MSAQGKELSWRKSRRGVRRGEGGVKRRRRGRGGVGEKEGEGMRKEEGEREKEGKREEERRGRRSGGRRRGRRKREEGERRGRRQWPGEKPRVKTRRSVNSEAGLWQNWSNRILEESWGHLSSSGSILGLLQYFQNKCSGQQHLEESCQQHLNL